MYHHKEEIPRFSQRGGGFYFTRVSIPSVQDEEVNTIIYRIF